MIKPTVGRVVWFYKWVEGQGYKGPLAAHICQVHSDTHVNLMVIGSDGVPRPALTVELFQTDPVAAMSDYCVWMPYQKGQAAKTEALEKQLAG